LYKNIMISVTVEIGDSKVTLSGPEDFVREEVRHLTSKLSGKNPGAGASDQKTRSEAEAVTEAELVSGKRPANHSETVAVLAYCMRQNGTAEFTEDDMRRAYIRAKVRPPKVVAQAIRDARNSFDFIEAGSGKGLYRLSHHGERTVLFDLPRDSK
jgi:hypothetical protein